MFTSMFFYLFICLLLFGIGDVLGVATKAKVSAVFVSLMLFLVGFMTGVLPPDIIKLAGLTDVGKWSLIFVVFSMGTSLNIKQLIAEWRTVAVAVLSMIVLIVGSVVLIPVIGYQETIVSIPIINGGIVATQIMTSAAMDKGFAMAAALGTVLYAVQKFFGILLLLTLACVRPRKLWRNSVVPVLILMHRKKRCMAVQLLKKPSLKNTKNSMVLLLL